MNIKFSIMTSDDFDFTLRMTDSEKWGYLRADFERHIEFDPQGCFIARSDNEYAGMITTTSYNHYGFIGGLIVPREWRGHGIGEKLMLHGIDYLRGKGVTSIELDGVFPAVPLYRKLGFRDKYLSLRFGRDPDNNIKPGNIQPSISINDIIKFDKRKTGLDRSRLLRGLYEQIPDSAFIDKNDNSFGYAIIKPCAGNYSLIGPMVCDNLKNAENLVTAIIQKYGNRILTIGVPEKNKAFLTC